MRYLLAGLFFACSAMPQRGLAAEPGVACVLDPKSVVARSAAGINQVSNLGDIQVRCSVPARPVSLKPGEGLYALRAKSARAFLLLPDGDKKEVPMEVIGFGGGGNPGTAYVDFYLHPPLDPPERAAEMQRALARLNRETAKDSSHFPEKTTEEEQHRKGAAAEALVFQHRAGRFRVECYLAQGDRPVGTGEMDFEVLYKGRFSDVWPFPDTAK